MYNTFFIILLSITCLAGYSQTLDSLVMSVERNNPNIRAQENWLKAVKLKSRIGIYPDNPEVVYQYLWGNSKEYGDQKEFEVIQSFRLPMYYTQKSAMQNLRYDQEEMLAASTRNKILHQARVEYFSLAWLVRRDSLLSERLQDSEKLVSLLESGFEKNEIPQTVLDKGKIFYLNTRNEWHRVRAEMEIHKENIKQLNGGELPGISSYEYPPDWMLTDLDSLIAYMESRNPEILSARLLMGISEKQVQFEKASSYPIFETGYKSETILNQKLKGIHAGISIPLWENKNRVSEARLENIWTRSYFDKVKSEEIARLKNTYLHALTLYENYNRMKEITAVPGMMNSSLQLLQSGQISFLEYLTEVQFIYESLENFLYNEREYYSALSEIRTFFISGY
ncbi:MAG TPA: TolC family protein [Cyclobacteriaceae bacterium]|nr:TolC family protein [Cyclobacteriaceae bacterium]